MSSLPTWPIEGSDGVEEREVLPYGEGLGHELTGLLPSTEHCHTCGWRGSYEELPGHDECGACGGDNCMTTVYGFDADDMRKAYEFDAEWLAQQLVHALKERAEVRHRGREQGWREEREACAREVQDMSCEHEYAVPCCDRAISEAVRRILHRDDTEEQG